MKIFTFLRTLFKSPYQYELRFFLPEKIRTQLNIVSIKNLTTFFQEKEIPLIGLVLMKLLHIFMIPV